MLKLLFSKYFLIINLLFFLILNTTVFPEAVKKNKKNTPQLNSSLQSSRGYNRFHKTTKQEQGNFRFFRSTTLDGNLVTGAITNSGILSHANISIPPISWPKGPEQVSYLFGTYFYCAAEVIDENGDTIVIMSDHYRFGEQSPDQTHGYYFMPLPKYFNLDQPDAQEEPLIFGISEDVGNDGIPNTGDPGEGDGQLQPIEDFNKNGRLDLQMQNVVGWFATSSRKETWPEYWPAGTYPGDDRVEGDERPGPRAGRWNGEFGAFVRGDQESYFVTDDRENDEFDYFPFDDADSRRPWPNGRRGLGLTVEARTYQWNARLAEDILINIYDITNNGKNLEKTVVGMLVDPDMGGPAFNDDADFELIDDITFTWNKGGRTTDKGLPIGYFGFAFLESPGLGNDGIDNDGDGLIDESQTNGIDDDNDWRTWEDSNGNGTYDNEDINFNGTLDAGEDINDNGILDIEPINDDTGSDGLGPEDFEYGGADPDGSEANGIPDLGEPNFEFTDNDESDQVGLTSWFLRQGSGGMDDDQGFWDLALQPGTFAEADGVTDIAFIYGSGFVRFADNERTHRYAIALAFGNDFPDILRNKRTIQIIYDNDYSFAKPPLQPTLTAIGGNKKVYLKWDNIAERSTDPIYGKDFEAYNIYKSTDPTFTEIKTITDGFGNPLLFKPLVTFDKIDRLRGLHPVRLGSELGGGSDLGVTYNMGDDSGLQHFFVDEDVDNGRTYYYAVASLDQGYHPSFFPDISPKENLAEISPTESSINIQIDPLGRPIAFDRNTAQVIPTEMTAGWEEPRVSDEGFQHVAGNGTGNISFQVFNPLAVNTGYRYQITFQDNGQYEGLGDNFTGKMDVMEIFSISEDATLGIYQQPKNFDLDEQYILDGIQFLLFNDSTQFDTAASSWSGNSTMIIIDNNDSDASTPKRDYEIRVKDAGADTSINRRVMNFQVWDVTDPENSVKQKYLFVDAPIDGVLNQGDKLTIVNDQRRPIWRFDFGYPANGDTIPPQSGDVYQIRTRKSFDRNDVIEFTVVGNSINAEKAKNELDNIYVVPDPYIAVNRLERRILNLEEGRGERRIDFVNLPEECKVSIFTAAGRLVQSFSFSASGENRRASWDLRTKDGLEIAHGVYFYAVEAPGIGVKTGKFAIIK